MGDVLSVVSLVAFVVMLTLAVRLMRDVVSSTRRARRLLVWSAVTWVGAFVLSIAVSPPTSYDGAGGPDGDPQMSIAGHTQTWPKGYTRTTCEEFDEEMTSSEQFAAAADMLTSVWLKIEDTTSFPGDPLIEQYRDEVESHCDVPTQSIAEVAWAIWINDPRFAA